MTRRTQEVGGHEGSYGAGCGAAIVALVAHRRAWCVQFDATLTQTGSVGETLWTILRFFTMLGQYIGGVITFGAVAHWGGMCRLGAGGQAWCWRSCWSGSSMGCC